MITRAAVGTAVGTAAAGAAVVGAFWWADTRITDAYVANKNDEITWIGTEARLASENRKIQQQQQAQNQGQTEETEQTPEPEPAAGGSGRRKGPVKANDAPGITAGGQATNEHGQKIAPSGRPQINNVKKNTREAAKNAANRGSGTVEHRTPTRGKRHFHTRRGTGKKKQDGTHYTY
jgi:hypothetical protein